MWVELRTASTMFLQIRLALVSVFVSFMLNKLAIHTFNLLPFLFFDLGSGFFSPADGFLTTNHRQGEKPLPRLPKKMRLNKS
jgi:hypothetical protein